VARGVVDCVRYAERERRKDEGPGTFLDRTPGLPKRARLFACVPCLYALIARRCPAWDAAGAMKAEPTTYRLYSCVRCGAQVSLCLRCDRGNRYCLGGCARIRRRESLLRAGARYQQSYRGACRHAARQRAWRARCAQKVTHQGSAEAGLAGTVALVVTDETLSVACDDDHRLSESWVLGRTEHRSLPARHCSRCTGVLPAFARLGPLRSGP